MSKELLTRGAIIPILPSQYRRDTERGQSLHGLLAVMIRRIVQHDDRVVAPVWVLTVKRLRQSEEECDEDLRVDGRLGYCEVDLA